MLKARPQYREETDEEDDDEEEDDDDEDYGRGGRRRGIDHASRPKRAAAKQAEQQLKVPCSTHVPIFKTLGIAHLHEQKQALNLAQ